MKFSILYLLDPKGHYDNRQFHSVSELCMAVYVWVLLSKSSWSITLLQFSSLYRWKSLTCFWIYLHNSAPLSRSHPPVTTGGRACEAALHLCLHPLPLRSILSRIEEWPQCHSGPRRWPQPCKQWCLCLLPGPGCRLLSSPHHRSSLEGIPGAAGSGGHRRWQWALSGELQYHYLEGKIRFTDWKDVTVFKKH